MRPTAAALGVLLLLAACSREEKEAAPGKTEKGPDAPTPVRVAAVERVTLTELVSGPGRTAALSQQKVRAPFAGTLTELLVVAGDSVKRGQVVGTIVSRESEAALSGAREMLREARSASQRTDADRALALAEQNLVRKALRASADGAVLSHAAAAGDRVSEDQEILTIEDAGSIVFLADMAQTDLPRIRPHQRARIELGGRPEPISGIVHGVLPSANAADFTGPVRIDLSSQRGRLSLGLFGMAHIVVGEHANATAVPDAALVRDDVSGVSRIALTAGGRAHWVRVTPGLKENGRTEILAPPLRQEDRVLVSGLVGLPEGKLLAIQP